jgi:hypothetical protein
VDIRQLEQLGDQLRGIGHRRRELVEMVSGAVGEGERGDAGALYEELSDVTSQAIDLMERQRRIIAEEVARAATGRTE